MIRSIVYFITFIEFLFCSVYLNASYGEKVFFVKNYHNTAKFIESIPLFDAKSAQVRHDLFALFSAYPKHCIGIELGKNNGIHVIMNNDKRFAYDDGKMKTFEEKMDNPDLQDMMEQTYIPGSIKEEPINNYDPGRIRVIPFFMAIYGKTKDDVLKNSKKITFIEKKITFSSIAGASDALKRVNDKLSILLKKRPELTKYVIPLGGTLNWRVIAGTQRLSPHSFATAIDLNTKQGFYWRWGIKRNISQLRKAYPIEIINIFEEQGFIWGGKWDHYDLMHFEYRPELITHLPD